MPSEPRGIHRTRRKHGSPDKAYVTDGTIGLDIPEARYREREYEPKFDDLPWTIDEEHAFNTKPSDGAHGACARPILPESSAYRRSPRLRP